MYKKRKDVILNRSICVNDAAASPFFFPYIFGRVCYMDRELLHADGVDILTFKKNIKSLESENLLSFGIDDENLQKNFSVK